MNRNLSLDSSPTESDVFYMDRSSEEGSPITNNTPAVLNSPDLSGAMATQTASLEPRSVPIYSNFNQPTFPYWFGNQEPIMPPSLNVLNLPYNPFNLLPTMVVIRKDKEYSRESMEPSGPSLASTPP